MDSRNSVRNLGETLESLLGLKAHLTPNWVKSVCDIIKTLPSNLNQVITFDDKDGEDDNASCNTISKIKDELAALSSCINQLNIQRRQILNDFLDLKGNIRAFCRIRPITLGETFGQVKPVVAVNESDVLLKLADNKSKSYSFDRVFHPGSIQAGTADEVFSEVEPVIKSVLDGYNACIFAYGQTGTGKTFTMEGTPDEPGVVPRTFEALFKQAVESNHSFLISFSMLEIYMGNLRDLLIPKSTRPTDPISPCLSVQTDSEGGIEIENLVSIQVNDFHQALRLYRLGCRFRSTASTNSNITSSRSHCMIRIAITCFDAPKRRRGTNKIWLVDLGGSERVLKTKAWGKRLDEGKAINLSLSALGDVIYALQRKKRHIPYRNSKLTQVLKDSLGNDSKTLMLVHVSPKEEDLCETICSLNFAARAKNIHLGNTDTIEVRQQKEVAMENLQKKMIEIEHERLHARREIEKLEKRLENLTGKSLSSEEQLETHGFMEEPLTENRAGDTAVAPISKLPSFMRPTICSRRKSGTISQISECKIPVTGRRRRPSSQRAESLSFPVKDHSDFKSEHSVSRSSCLVGLDRRNSADNATEYSQETSEIDDKLSELREKGKVPSSSASQMAEISHNQKNTNGRTGKTNYNKFFKVENWLDLQKNRINMSGYTHRTKRVLAIPTPEKKHGRNEQNKAKKCLDDFRKQKVVNQNNKDMVVTDGGFGRATSHLEVDKPPVLSLQDLFNADLESDSNPVYQTTKAKIMIQTQESLDISWTEDDKWSIYSPADVSCPNLGEYKDDDGANALSIMEEKEDKEISESLQLNNHGYCEFLQSDSDGSINYSQGDSGDSMSILEIERCCQKIPLELIMEDSERKDSEVSRPLSKEQRNGILQLRAQKALFMNYSNKKDLTKQIDKPQDELHHRGICHILKQKIETLCASALLGLGLCSLGYEHEFFYSLML